MERTIHLREGEEAESLKMEKKEGGRGGERRSKPEGVVVGGGGARKIKVFHGNNTMLFFL